MKKVIAIFSIFTLTASMLFNLFIIGDYIVQYKYYSEVLCVNKDKPEMHCNGTCHLAADLAQEENPEVPLPVLREFKENFTVSHFEMTPVVFGSDVRHDNFKTLKILLPQEVILGILHPPQSIVLG